MKTVHRLLKIIESVTVASIIALFMVALLGQSASATFPRPPKFSSANSTLVNIVGDSLIFLNKSTGDTIAVLTTNSIRGFGDLNVPDSVLANWALIDSSLSVSGQVITVGGLQTQAGFVLSLGGKSFYYNSDSARFFMTDSLQVSNGFIAPLVRTNDIYSRNGTDVDILVAGTKELTVTSAGVSVPNGYLVASSGVYTASTNADSLNVTKHYSDHYLVDDSIVIPANIGDKWVLSYDSANGQWGIEAQQGDTGLLVYGELWDTIASAQTITCTTSVWRGWYDTVMVGDTSGVTYFNGSGGTDRRGDGIIVDSTGYYLVVFNTSFTGTNSAALQCALHVNSTLQPDMRFIVDLPASAVNEDNMFSGLVSLTAGDTVDVRWTAGTDGHTADILYANLLVYLIQNQTGGGGSGSGSEDSVYVVDSTGTVYDNIADNIRLKAGNGVRIGREDSTSFDLLRLLLDTSNVIFDSSLYADFADSARVVASEDIDYSATSIPNTALQSDVSLLGQTIESGDIFNQEIIKDDIDTTSKFVVDSLFYGTSASADSAVATKRYVDAQVTVDTSLLVHVAGDVMTGALDMDGNNLVDAGGLSYAEVSTNDTIPVIIVTHSLGGGDTQDSIFYVEGGSGSNSIYNTFVWQFLAGFVLNSEQWVDLTGIGLTNNAGTLDVDTATLNSNWTIATSDSTNSITDGGIDLADIGTNGATENKIIQYVGGQWTVQDPTAGTGYWDTTTTDNIIVWTIGSDTGLFMEFSDGGSIDTTKLYQKSGNVLIVGDETATHLDTIIMGADTIIDMTGSGLVQSATFALTVDTATLNSIWKIATATTADSSVISASSNDVDTTGTDISTALGNRMDNTGDTVTGTYDFSGGYINDVNIAQLDSVQLSTGEYLYWDAGNTRARFTDGVTFGGEVISEAGGIFANGGNYFSNSSGSGSADSWFGYYVYDGQNNGSYVRYRASSDFWQLSHPLYLSDTTTTDSLFATEGTVKALIEDSLNNYIDSARVMDSIQANDNAVRASIRDTILTGGAITGDLVVNAYKGDSTVTDSQYITKAYADGGLLNNITVRGDLGVLGNFYNLNFSNELKLERAYAKHNNSYVELPANPVTWEVLPDDSTAGFDSSLAVHPSVQYFPHGFYGYEAKKKIMAFTPLINGLDAYENPYLVWADAGTNDWSPIVFGTDTLANPVFDTSDFPGSDHLSDVETFLDDQERLWLVARVTYDSTGTVADSNILVISRFDTTALGVPTMTTPVTIYSEGNVSALSPTIILDTNSTYSMWFVEPVDSSSIGISRVVRYTCSATDSLDVLAGWNFKDTTSIAAPHDSLKMWHMEFVANGIDALLLLAACTDTATTSGDSANLYIGISYDRGSTVQWADSSVYPVQPILATARGEADSSQYWSRTVYRSSGYWVNDGSDQYLNLYYSAFGPVGSGGNTQWRIFNTELRFDGGYVIDTIPFDRLPGLPAIDSTILSFDEVLSGVPIIARDSATSAATYTANDTLYFTWDNLPTDLYSIDTLLITYKISDTAQTNIKNIETQGISVGGVMPDSVYADVLTGTLARSIWVTEKVPINSTDFQKQQQAVIKVTTAVDGGENIYFGRVELICTKKQ